MSKNLKKSETKALSEYNTAKLESTFTRIKSKQLLKETVKSWEAKNKSWETTGLLKRLRIMIPKHIEMKTSLKNQNNLLNQTSKGTTSNMMSKASYDPEWKKTKINK